MNHAGLRTTLTALLSVIGLLFATLLLLMCLTATQAMSGEESFVSLLGFFSVSFALAFGTGAASAFPLAGRAKVWPSFSAFATGGAVGGALLAFAYMSVTRFEPQLRTLMRGGPLGGFLLAAHLAVLVIAVVVGRALLRRSTTRK